ncbi:MAG: hypothetical protein KGQ28_11085, partial [Hyphomicrobiales bacterium]|nr:hypothetical protein [Hyphomicrobiales bacterium]
MDTSSSRKIASSGACLAAAAIVALSAARAQTPPPPDMKNRPPLPPGMEYYPKPILSHGRWVLWHGKGRVAAGEGRQDKAAAKSPARAAAPPKAAATATTILVSVGASTDARIVEDMRAALGPSGAAISAKVGAATSKELADGLGGADLAIARSDGIAVMEGASKDAPPLAYVAPL